MKSFIFVLLLGAVIIGGEIWWFDKHPRPIPPPPVPEIVTTSPDGTKLWRVEDPKTGEWVYFSTAGASWNTIQQLDGMGATRTVRHNTPNTKR